MADISILVGDDKFADESALTSGIRRLANGICGSESLPEWIKGAFRLPLNGNTYSLTPASSHAEMLLLVKRGYSWVVTDMDYGKRGDCLAGIEIAREAVKHGNKTILCTESLDSWTRLDIERKGIYVVQKCSDKLYAAGRIIHNNAP